MTTTTLECLELETGPNPTHTVIWMHGLGADGHDFVPVVPELRLPATPSIRFIFPHAPVQPVTLNNGMPMRAWYDIYLPAPVRKEDEAGLRQSEQRIRSLIAKENARGIPTRNIVLAGFSQGCAMTLQTGLRLEESLAGMVCLSGYLPLPDKTDKERRPENQNTPIFMAHGTADPMVELGRAQAAYQWLTERGYDVQWETYPMPHSVCMEEIVDISGFLQKVLKG